MATQPVSLLHVGKTWLDRTHARLVQGTCDKIVFCVCVCFLLCHAVLVKCAGFDSSQGTQLPSAATNGVPSPGPSQPGWCCCARSV